MSCPLARSQPARFLFLTIGSETSLRSKAMYHCRSDHVVKQLASEIRKDVLKDVVLDVLKRARLSLEVSGEH